VTGTQQQKQQKKLKQLDNSTLFNSQKVIEEIREEIKKFLD
jgi:hypothetical protein